MIIQDDSGGLFVTSLPAELTALAVGPAGQAEGPVWPGNFSPRLHALSVRAVGTRPRPDPLPASAEDLPSGRLDRRYVEVRGVVRTAAVDPDFRPPRQIAELAGAGDLWVLNFDPAAAAGLVDAADAVRGVCLVSDTPRRRLRGVRLLVSDVADVRVFRSPAGDPFGGPAVEPGRLSGYHPDGR